MVEQKSEVRLLEGQLAMEKERVAREMQARDQINREVETLRGQLMTATLQPRQAREEEGMNQLTYRMELQRLQP